MEPEVLDDLRLPEARAPRHLLIIPERAARRAAQQFTLDPDSGCHVSKYSVGSHGYAQIGWQSGLGRRRCTTAHRAAWVAARGPIPDGLTVDHICNNRRCVNVEHLRLLANFENARRTYGRDWPVGNCANGHDNRYLAQSDATGRWRCSRCARSRKCVDCGAAITSRATRCGSCAATNSWVMRRRVADVEEVSHDDQS